MTIDTMKLYSLPLALFPSIVLACQAGPAGDEHAPHDNTAIDIERAVKRSLPLMQASMDTWVREVECLSCHHQGLGAMAVSLAKERGFEIDQASLDDQATRMAQRSADGYAAHLQGEFSINPAFGLSYMLIARAAAGHLGNDTTEAMVYDLAGHQSDRGAWYSESHRPPLEDSPVTSTALAARALSLYGPDGRSWEIEHKLQTAREWLEAVAPRSNEERVMKVLGLGWTGASDAALQDAAEDLAKQQRADGGWAQIATIESDAYATGQALVALQQMAGLSVESTSYRRGVRYLLNEQLADGSWRIETRRRSPGLPYFESGFPHKRDQFISFACTAWATMALCLTIEPGLSAVFHGTRPRRDATDTFAMSAGMRPIHLAAAYGTRDDLRDALAEEPSAVQAMGPGGVTPLMLAVHDVEKVALLLDAGAEVSPRTSSQNTALILAAWYSGAGESLEQLLAHGASLESIAQDGSTALLRAVKTGEIGKVTLLLDDGADIEAANEEGFTALSYAECAGDLDMLQLLLDRGASGAEIALTLAAFDGWTELVDALIAHGAELDAIDEMGMTALGWAAKVDHGHSDIAAALLAAGADPSIPSTSGRTPLEWAEYFDNELVAELLREAVKTK